MTTDLVIALQTGEETAVDFGAYPMPCFEARYFAEHSEHITISGVSVIHWSHAERIVSLATGAPSMDCVRLGFRGPVTAAERSASHRALDAMETPMAERTW